MRPVIIYGAKATGKTVNAEQLRAHYRCKSVLDDWPHAHREPKAGDLVLTTLTEREIDRRYQPVGGVRLVPVNTARRAIGLGPAPANGFAVEPSWPRRGRG